LDLEIRDNAIVATHRQPLSSPISDIGAAVRHGIEAPISFPALNRALTPDDHVTVVVDDRLPHQFELLVPILEHIVGANVRSERITVVHRSERHLDKWSERVPAPLENVRFELHDPTD